MATRLSTAELETALDEFPIELLSIAASVPAVDQYDALEAYRALDDGALAEARQALAAYVTHQQYFAA